MNFFTPYEGNEPYIFVSYAHANSPEVMRVISDMHERGYRIWYDEGIEVGSEWPECIAEHLSAALSGCTTSEMRTILRHS